MPSQETSQRNDSFADDHMLEDAFGMEAARRQAINEPAEENVQYHEAAEDDMNHMNVDEGIEITVYFRPCQLYQRIWIRSLSKHS